MSDEPAMKRRQALKVIATTTAAAIPLAELPAAPAPNALPPAPALEGTQGVPRSGPRGTPSDPDLWRAKADWPRKLTVAELATLSALCDMIIPADAKSPSASTVGVPAYINEYVSAPADWYQRTLLVVRGGLAWLDVESHRRFGHPFTRLTTAQKSGICDDICYLPRAKPEFTAAAKFFARVRDLTAEGFYTTAAGMKDIGYIGNQALPRFDGPPPEVLKHLGLE